MTRKLRTNGRFNYGSLEPRQLLASVSLESGLLKIVGTSGDDEVQLEIVDDDNVRVLDDDVDIENSGDTGRTPNVGWSGDGEWLN